MVSLKSTHTARLKVNTNREVRTAATRKVIT